MWSVPFGSGHGWVRSAFDPFSEGLVLDCNNTIYRVMSDVKPLCGRGVRWRRAPGTGAWARSGLGRGTFCLRATSWSLGGAGPSAPAEPLVQWPPSAKAHRRRRCRAPTIAWTQALTRWHRPAAGRGVPRGRHSAGTVAPLARPGAPAGAVLPARASTRRYTPRVGNRRRPPVAKPYVRLTQPLVRDTKGGELRPASWDEALDRTVAGFHGRQGGPRPDDIRHLQLLEGDQRGQLCGAEVQPGGPGQQQHRQLQPDVTRP